MYNTILIDPRPASKEAMINLLQKNTPVWGIECTLPALTPYIDINIDGQHISGASNVAACELALDCDLPPFHTTLAIVRPDADAMMAAAILGLRYMAQSLDSPFHNPNENVEMLDRIRLVAKQDTFDNGDWPGRDGFKESDLEGSDTKALGIIASDFKMPIEERIELFKNYILEGSCKGLQEAKDQASATFEKLLKESIVSFPDDYPDYGIVIVESAQIGATGIGYRHNPVVIVKNSQFRFAGGEPHLKYTICAWKPKYLNFQSLNVALNELETAGTWGGSASIVGSPQGVSSSLSINQIVSLVKSNML